MDGAERVIGRLEEFKKYAEKEFHEIKSDIKLLNQFKWRIAGGAGVLSVVISLMVTIVIELLKK